MYPNVTPELDPLTDWDPNGTRTVPGIGTKRDPKRVPGMTPKQGPKVDPNVTQNWPQRGPWNEPKMDTRLEPRQDGPGAFYLQGLDKSGRRRPGWGAM